MAVVGGNVLGAVVGGGLCVGAVVAWVLTLPRLLVYLASKLHRDVLFFRRTRVKAVALTLDDGPGACTRELLATLREFDCKATFFIIGTHARAHPELLALIREEGHEVGNHMWRDEPTWRLSPADFERQLLAVDSIISPCKDSGGRKWFRPGHGILRPWMMPILARYGYHAVLGNAYGWDPANRSPWLVAQLLKLRAGPGSIAVAHDGGEDRRYIISALRTVLADLQQRGYAVCTLGQLLELTTA